MSAETKEFLNFSKDDALLSASAKPLGVDKKAARKLLAAMMDPPIAIELWDGDVIQTCKQQPEIVVRIKNRRALWGIILNPDLKLGEAYSLGALEVEGDLVRLVELGSVRKPKFLSDRSVFGKAVSFINRGARSNTMAGSKSNIHHHYDLSNEFYRLWLDRDHMQYTCAYFQNLEQSIEKAQAAKLHHVCRKLRLEPGDEVVEAGCGWGGLGLFMAKEYGAKVTAYNISHEQVKFAQARARQEGLEGRVEYVEDDYRNARGNCDVFVSVGMLEHVGKDNYKTLGGVIDRCLREDGRGLIHSIGRNAPRPMNRWIEKRIFPGAYPPTLREMGDIFEPFDFSVMDVENLRLHYAKTLEQWLQRYEDSVDTVRKMFDENFVRAWRLYLSGSIAAFRVGDLQLFQVMFQRGQDNNLAWTREHLYV